MAARSHTTVRSLPVLQLSAVLVLLLIVVDGLAVLGIVGTRQAARQAAVDELGRRAEVQARGCEAALATLRADLLFLAGSSRLAESWQRSRSQDPLVERWARLETESSLLQFMDGHPGLITLAVREGDVETAVVRRQRTDQRGSDVPTVVSEAGPIAGWTFALELPMTLPEPAGPNPALNLEARVDPNRLLEAVTPGLGGALVLGSQALETDDELLVVEPIDARGWQVEGPVVLERREEPGRLVGTVETLVERYRTTVLLNVLVLLLAIPLGLLAVREARRSERLVSENEYERERRRMERQVWHQERLATLGRLTADLAHEINNPLAGVSNHLSLLEDDVSQGKIDEARRRLPKLRHGIERITTTVRRALSLAAPGHQEWEAVDLRRVVADSVALLADSVDDLELDLPASNCEPVIVEAEAAALVQVVTNLVLNAVQVQNVEAQSSATRNSETRAEVTIEIGSDGSEARLEVLDRGPGIAPEVMEHLFEPFVSGRGSTGLGLSVCHGIVAHHGGRIEAENRPDGGARFVVHLPLAAAVQEAS